MTFHRTTRRSGGWLLALVFVGLAIGRPAAAQTPPGSDDASMDSLFAAAAATAWHFVETNYEERTGLVKATASYPFVTTWDVGSMLAAYHSARGLGLIDQADFDRRTGRLLETLRTLPLVDSVAFNRNYRTTDAAMVDRRDQPTRQGWGWSVTDLGRLLVWLRIIADAHPAHAAAAETAARRLNFDRLVAGGYIWGQESWGSGIRRYQEGRIGYEQYAASGFALWGHRADFALNVEMNALPDSVFGVPLPRDRRGMDRLTSEPFVLKGLEVGWTEAERDLAERVLRVQHERYRRTGEVTIVSEDAVSIAPHYFYYYAVLANGEPFRVDVASHDKALDSPRWVSTKMSFGWHAVLPDEYTALAVRTVQPARDRRQGWSSGVFEKTHRPTYTRDLNTSAVILEAALFRELGVPLLEAARAGAR